MDQMERKERTEALLQTKGIPFLEWLPCVESEEETELRTPEEVGIRMACLFCVIGHAFYPSETGYRSTLQEHQLWDHLSPDEAAFVTNPTPDRKDAVNFTWRVEALFLLMWAANLFEELPFPETLIENEVILERFPDLQESPWAWIRNLTLRPKSEILDASDLIYRLHWATRQALVHGEPCPPGVDPEVVQEWHHAINWLTNYGDEPGWDRVWTDT